MFGVRKLDSLGYSHYCFMVHELFFDTILHMLRMVIKWGQKERLWKGLGIFI